MKGDDEYEILPRTELEYLRHEVEKLKRNPLGETQASISLLESMNRLNGNIERLVGIFQSANDEMVKAFNDQSFKEQLQKVRSENAKIAHGIVAVAEIVKGVEKKLGESSMATPAPSHERPPAGTSPPQYSPKPKEPQAPRSDSGPADHIQFDEEGLSQELQTPQNPFEVPGQPDRKPIIQDPLPRPGPEEPPHEQHIPEDEVPPPPPGR